MKKFSNAKWICCKKAPDGAVVAFTKTLYFDKPVEKAVLRVTAAGIYEVYCNGEKLGNRLFKPGLTSYKKRLQYQSFAVAKRLVGKVELRIEVAPGWAVGTFIVTRQKGFSDYVATIAELIGSDQDGNEFAFVTDESWEARSTPITYSDIYHGETVDYTAPIVEYGKVDTLTLQTEFIKQIGAGVVENEKISPVKQFVTPKGERVIDFGQNLTGFVQIYMQGKAGERVYLSCAETLDKDGNFYNENLRRAKCLVHYVLDGTPRVYKETFSFQGFRYIRVDECPDWFWENLPRMQAVAVHSKIRRTGYFTCGNEKVNQLYHNIIWSQKGNYLDIPTDCPQRDERLGWAGDAQIFARTATYNFDVYEFLRKWLGDLRLEQGKNGSIGGSCPIFEEAERTSAGFGDAVVIVPWELYRAYGKKEILRENFQMMKKWIEYVRKMGDNEYLWLGDWHFGDWLAMDEGMEDSYVGATANDLVASAFYAYSLSLFVKVGNVLGEDMREYEDLLVKVKQAYKEYFTPNGELLEEYPYTEWQRLNEGETGMDLVRKGKTQTALTLTLAFDLASDREKFANQLEEMLVKNGGRMTTGFLGTPYLLPTLTATGNVKRAYDLLLYEGTPSWLYAVNHGATTIWEHWNGIKEDGSFWATEMNSFNHYAYGSVGGWLYETVAGIRTQDGFEGYKKAILAPMPDRRLGFVDCVLDTRNGRIKSSWKYQKEGVKFVFTVPKGMEAEIRLPNGVCETVTGGKHEYFMNL